MSKALQLKMLNKSTSLHQADLSEHKNISQHFHLRARTMWASVILLFPSRGYRTLFTISQDNVRIRYNSDKGESVVLPARHIDCLTSFYSRRKEGFHFKMIKYL